MGDFSAKACREMGCKAPVPTGLAQYRMCVFHFSLFVEQECAEIRRETALGRSSHDRQVECIRQIVANGEMLVNAAMEWLPPTRRSENSNLEYGPYPYQLPRECGSSITTASRTSLGLESEGQRMSTDEQNDSALNRRKMSRLGFTALAKVVDVETRATFSMRMTDIGTGGCFLDTMFPLSIGSRVRVTLGSGRMQFHADGQVVSSQAPLGMGIAFDELTPDQRVALMRLV